MKRNTIRICDYDGVYISMLHGFLNERIKLPLAIYEFTDPIYLEPASEEENILLLVISESALQSALDSKNICVKHLKESNKILLLQEDESSGLSLENRVSKYSKASDISDKILEIISKSKELGGIYVEKELKTEIIGFFSPLGRCMQSRAAFVMSQYLSRRGETMYLNFAPFPERSYKDNAQGDFSDLMYFFEGVSESFPVKLQQLTFKIGDVNTLNPARNYLQLVGAEIFEWTELIKQICICGKYEYLILDLSIWQPALMELLSICSKIFTIAGNDVIDKKKMDSYKNCLASEGKEHILSKTFFCRLPVQNFADENINDILATPLGAYIREKMLREIKQSK